MPDRNASEGIEPRKYMIAEADSLNLLEGYKDSFAIGQMLFSLPGSKSVVWYRMEIIGTWEAQPAF